MEKLQAAGHEVTNLTALQQLLPAAIEQPSAQAPLFTQKIMGEQDPAITPEIALKLFAQADAASLKLAPLVCKNWQRLFSVPAFTEMCLQALSRSGDTNTSGNTSAFTTFPSTHPITTTDANEVMPTNRM